MQTYITTVNYIRKVYFETDKLIYAHNRWDSKDLLDMYKKSVFENLLADYYISSHLKNIFSDFSFEIELDYSIAKSYLTLKIEAYVDTCIKLIIWKNNDINNLITQFQNNRRLLLQEIEKINELKDKKNELSLIIVKYAIIWYNTIQNINNRFYLGKVKSISSLEVKKDFPNNEFFSGDIFRSFQNYLSQKHIKNSNRILSISPFVNLLPISLWFEGYEITLVSNKLDELIHISKTVSQFRDLADDNLFNPLSYSKSLSKFNILYDGLLNLERFSKLELESYSGILLNFTFSLENKIDLEKIKTFFSILQSLLVKDGIIILQEAANLEKLFEELFKNLNIKILLKVKYFEDIEKINWLVIKD